MLGKNFSLLFYLKKPKVYVSDPMPVYMHITVDGDIKELCTSRQCDPKAWHKEGERAISRTEEAKELNSHLSLLKLKAFEARSVLIAENKTLTAQAIKNRLTGKRKRQKVF